MIRVFLDWQQAYDAGIGHCGGKGWNLARLHALGFYIPTGGVLDSAVYSALVGHPDILEVIHRLHAVGDQKLLEPSTVELSEELHRRLLEHGLPVAVREQLEPFLDRQNLAGRPLAVRSSATLEDGDTTSFAGVHASYLNIVGVPAIERAMLDCFSSLWTPRALSYRRKMKVDDRALACALVLAELVDAKASGIAFSCDPVSGREDITLINANHGLGESVVGGLTGVDEYQVERHRPRLLKRITGNKRKLTVTAQQGGCRLIDNLNANEPVLTEAQILLLAQLVQRVFWSLSDGEQHQDIEWAFDGERFVLLQARPATALPRLTCDALREQTDCWSNGNLRDAAPMVLHTLGASLLPFHIDTIMRAAFDAMHYPLPKGIRFSRLFQGRLYFNLSLIQWAYYDSVGVPPEATNRNMGGHQSAIDLDAIGRGGWRDQLRRARTSIGYLREMNRHRKIAAARNAAVAAYADSVTQMDLQALDDYELAQQLQQVDQRCEAYARPFILLSSLSGFVGQLFDLLEKYIPNQGAAVGNALLAGAGGITSADHGYRLQTLRHIAAKDAAALAFFNATPFQAEDWVTLPNASAFRQDFSQYLKDYGHRAVYEIDLSKPRWREAPGYLLNIIRQGLGQPPSEQMRARQQKAEQAWQTVRKQVPTYLYPLVKWLVKKAANGSNEKEQAKSTYIRLLEPLRYVVLEAGRRLQTRRVLLGMDDVFYCAYDEIIALLTKSWNGQGMQMLISRRRRKCESQERLPAPDLVLGGQPRYVRAARQRSGQQLSGMGVAAGRAEGKARLVHSPEQGITLEPGDILVAPSTDPAWTPLFLNVAAIVMETGGQLSHGAIVAREYGIPAVVNVPGLFESLTDSETIAVDGDRGIVERLLPPA